MPERFTTEVEAARLTADNLDEIAEWAGGRVVSVTDYAGHEPDVRAWVEIPTIDGVLTANPGDYVLLAGGAVSVASATAFEASYSPVVEG